MPFPVAVAASPSDWDLDIVWPDPAYDDNLFRAISFGADPFMNPAGNSWDSPAGVNNIPGTNQALGGSGGALITTDTVGTGNGIAWFDAPVAGHEREIGLEGMHIIGSTLNPTIAAGVQWPSPYKASWFSALVSYTAVAGPFPAANYGGLLMVPQNAIGQGWPTQPVGPNNRGGFGITSDGAGQWQYVSYNRAGVALQREAIALPAHVLTDWNLVEWFFRFDRAGFPATMDFYFNGGLIASRNWTGALLENKIGPVNFEYRFVAHSRIDDQGVQMLGPCQLRRGRFNRDGSEIQG